MPTILLETVVNAPIDRVFDLARNIDMHTLSTQKTNECAIAGRTHGCINLHETVTWKAKHFGIYQKLTVQITKMESPNFFEDEMLSGAFKSMKHTHFFRKENENTTIMTDEFYFQAPLGILGRIAEFVFLKKYMTNFLLVRNAEIKHVAETDLWQKILT